MNNMASWLRLVNWDWSWSNVVNWGMIINDCEVSWWLLRLWLLVRVAVDHVGLGQWFWFWLARSWLWLVSV